MALMTACGGWGGSSDSERASSAAATNLTIAVQPRGPSGPTRTWTLTCDPPGGTLPRARAACDRLSADLLRPLPAGTVCTQIYGGPQTARVRGHLGSKQINTRFSRTNGCEIHHWDSARFLLPVKI